SQRPARRGLGDPTRRAARHRDRRGRRAREALRHGGLRRVRERRAFEGRRRARSRVQAVSSPWARGIARPGDKGASAERSLGKLSAPDRRILVPRSLSYFELMPGPGIAPFWKGVAAVLGFAPKTPLADGPVSLSMMRHARL